MANKELVEVLAGQRGEPLDAAVTWEDLSSLGCSKPEQVPYDHWITYWFNDAE